jgi:hypothetical protein
MKNPYLSRYSTTIAKKQASREVTSLPSPIDKRSIQKHKRQDGEKIAQVGKKFQPRMYVILK